MRSSKMFLFSVLIEGQAGLFSVLFIAEEIKEALFMMHPSKALGPDDFHAVF